MKTLRNHPHFELLYLPGRAHTHTQVMEYLKDGFHLNFGFAVFSIPVIFGAFPGIKITVPISNLAYHGVRHLRRAMVLRISHLRDSDTASFCSVCCLTTLSQQRLT